jgi:Fe-S-cluster containining protein
MCGECCKRYTIPVTLSDIQRISSFTCLNPRRFLELIIFDKSVASSYDGIPKIKLQGENNNILVLKEKDDRCMFLKDNRCSIHKVKPLRCRPFPFSYQNKRGKVAFTVNEEAIGFCKGLGRGSKEFDFADLSKAAITLDKEQDILRERVKNWNIGVVSGEHAKSKINSLLAFLLSCAGRLQSQPE